jgi:two-component system phosphate regulon response regulator OmpR
MDGTCILVVDAEAVTRRVLCSCFGSDGFRVLEADKPAQARTLLAAEAPDLVTLDVDLGQHDGLALARDIRKGGDAAIIIVSAKADRQSRISALHEFADDYIAKPFDMQELLARTRAVLRRTRRAPQDAQRSNHGRNGHGAVKIAGFTLDLQAHRVTIPSGTKVELTATEFKLLEVLFANPNRILSRERLLELSGGNGSAAAYDRAIDMRVRRLREKLGQRKAGAPDFIRTVRGFGYTFAVPADTASG